ncbi:hypothetical protein AT575_09720 [Streptococcus penaeicida]|uniref:HTH cro/C1-type domain-containing protein n=1 Tax=Streptococcus penaeicida TaxID=1765960 RepID=A0A2N8LA53_9STRE|nr:helix-turn-helix domain-containing protein [Streptococcus penaeicida]PND47048.1 hypothetical protein AT575_09720 [Streptococcus penaeicida]
MKKYTTAQRLKQLMDERGLKQVKILEMSKPYQEELDIYMSKSSLSEYVSGKSNPDQRKLTLLARTLGVDETWLMGYEVDKERGMLEILENVVLKSNKANKQIVEDGRRQFLMLVGDKSLVKKFEKEIRDNYINIGKTNPSYRRIDEWTEKWLDSFYTTFYFAEAHTRTLIARYYIIPSEKREPVDILLNSLSNYLIEDTQLESIYGVSGTVHIEED